MSSVERAGWTALVCGVIIGFAMAVAIMHMTWVGDANSCSAEDEWFNRQAGCVHIDEVKP